MVLNGNNQVNRNHALDITRPASRTGLSDNPQALPAAVSLGMDLSSTIHGAGGIGGLLACEEPQAVGDPKRYWFLYDAEPLTRRATRSVGAAGPRAKPARRVKGNGNVGQVLDATDTGSISIAARYEYDPYGNPIPIPQPPGPGPYADLNPFRFSTKWFDPETGLGNWGYRYYSPRLGRWISRDPIGEEGGLNLCAFVGNQPSHRVDDVGLSAWEVYRKIRGRPIRQAWGLSVAGNVVMGIGVAGAITPMFFPNSCEVALFGVYTSSFNGPPQSVAAGSVWQQIVWMAQNFNYGANIGLSFSGELAVYLGTGTADAASYEGHFYGGDGGVGPVSGQLFWGGGWYGGNVGVGVSFPPVQLNLQPEHYATIAGPLVLPNCLCYAVIGLH